MATLAFFSCKKETVNTTDPGSDEMQAFTNENVRFDIVFNDVFHIVADGAIQAGTFRTTSGAPIVTADTLGPDKRITIDFGNGATPSPDGRKRAGKIIVHCQGQFSDSASIQQIEFDQYEYNGFDIFGTIALTNKGRNEDGFINFYMTIDGGMVPENTTDSIFWVGNRTRILQSGAGTISKDDDVYLVSGTGIFRKIQGNKIQADISTPLMVTADCRYIRQGEMILMPESGNNRRLDFGDGNCDGNAKLTIYGRVYYITLPEL